MYPVKSFLGSPERVENFSGRRRRRRRRRRRQVRGQGASRD